MAFTLEEYIRNPINPNVKNKESMQERLKDTIKEYDVISKRMGCNKYVIKAHSKIVYHITIPSRSSHGVMYDIVFEFDTGSNRANSMDELPVRVFSNCPSFSYSVARAFHNNGLLITWLKNKYQSEIFKKKSEVINPDDYITFERTVYLAALYVSKDRNSIVAEEVMNKAKNIVNVGEISNHIDRQEYIENQIEVVKKIDREKTKRVKPKITNTKKPNLLSHKETTGMVSKITGGNVKSTSTNKINKTKKI